MMRKNFHRFFSWATATAAWLGAVLAAAPAAAQRPPELPIAAVEVARFEIARTSAPAALSAFLDPRTVPAGWARIDGFVQREPRDGEPATRRTEVFLGYDASHLHLLFRAFDGEPERIRARMSPREQIDGDDAVTVLLDTFHDRRRAYAFRANPLGVQWDALWTEGEGYDPAFDTVWQSEGALTGWGYLVRMAIPFRSLRFPPGGGGSWGVIFLRNVPRGEAEEASWPRVSTRVEGLLGQAGTLGGLAEISPGRNLQLIPFGSFRAFELIDESAAPPRQVRDSGDYEFGLDSKTVIQDRVVLDLTVNPDFSQLESDEPQITVNRRFEVFFPEKRPFFLENADLFSTPINLLFTRRIADPSAGARSTGKLGPFSAALLVADDRAPGDLAPAGHPLAGESALFEAVRLRRDVGEQSNLGLIYVGRELGGGYNRTAGVDGRFRLGDHWVTTLQAVDSESHDPLAGAASDGAAWYGALSRSGRRFNAAAYWYDVAPDFRSDAGFVPRTDLREAGVFTSYGFRPEGRRLIFWGPEFEVFRLEDHRGTRLDEWVEGSLEWHFTDDRSFEINYGAGRERLRPRDHPALAVERDFTTWEWCLEYGADLGERVEIEGTLARARRINFVPAPGAEPGPVDAVESDLGLALRPLRRLQIDNRLLWSRLEDPASGRRVLDEAIARSRWNWQFSRELSLRAIVEYGRTDADPALSGVDGGRRLNADLLLTWRLDPWTAVFVGYNGNARADELLPTADGLRLVPTGGRLVRDSQQVLVKVTYLFRY